MKILFLSFLLSVLSAFCAASSLSGPFLFWGHENVRNLQPNTLIEGDETDFANLYKNAKAVVVFVRNGTDRRLVGSNFPRLRELVQANVWSYLPQRTLAAEPFQYNTNIEVINLSVTESAQDEEIILGFSEATANYGQGSVLGILANTVNKSPSHSVWKRDAKDEELSTTLTTAQPPDGNETDESFVYVADGKKAVLAVNNAMVLNISNKDSYKLVEHLTTITFDDQTPKGYGRLALTFTTGAEKIHVRFNFTISRGTWTMKAVEVVLGEYKNVLTLDGLPIGWPSAPVGFSYRCSARPLVFSNNDDILIVNDFQVQPWLNGLSKFGAVYDCVGFTTAPIWAGVLVTLFLCGILSIGLMAIYDIKTPNRFESSRSKQLTFTVQE